MTVEIASCFFLLVLKFLLSSLRSDVDLNLIGVVFSPDGLANCGLLIFLWLI
jgi:hypothetical protein